MVVPAIVRNFCNKALLLRLQSSSVSYLGNSGPSFGTFLTRAKEDAIASVLVAPGQENHQKEVPCDDGERGAEHG